MSSSQDYSNVLLTDLQSRLDAMREKELSFELEKTKNELFEARKNLQNAIRREARYSEPVRSIERELESKVNA